MTYCKTHSVTNIINLKYLQIVTQSGQGQHYHNMFKLIFNWTENIKMTINHLLS